ncbi:hypothetical protein OG339_20995 [Streptosporangium sp. NBC_01495]|uniref:hypothetical protein n=1 Tax=Streptosporangium sp. NBC_01495 TaxID=2903899 RepID=UPI002E320D88|nr:hypothetical protein [Streptosporangium sp. NBC_01495]
MGGWGAVPAWARFPSPFGPWVMGVWVRLFGAAEGEGAVRGRAAARSSPAGWVRSRPWRPSPTPLSAVDLGQFVVWHNADLDPEHVLSTLALLPATRAEVEGLESRPAVHRPQRRTDLGADSERDGIQLPPGVPAALHPPDSATGRRLGSVLTRLRGYDTRFTAALARARAGKSAWVDRTDVDSCHRVWFQFHEDLIATLGLDRHTQP